VDVLVRPRGFTRTLDTVRLERVAGRTEFFDQSARFPIQAGQFAIVADLPGSAIIPEPSSDDDGRSDGPCRGDGRVRGLAALLVSTDVTKQQNKLADDEGLEVADAFVKAQHRVALRRNILLVLPGAAALVFRPGSPIRS
jgi:hypothetical protein